MEQSVHGFSVPFAFPVCFTWDTFSPANRVFVDTLRRLEPDRRHRALVVIDAHVATAHPTLTAEIDAYFGAHADALTLAAPPIVVPGGEAVKNDMTHPFLVLKHVNDVGLDRQSFIVAIGG